jgi:hypothetical protein
MAAICAASALGVGGRTSCKRLVGAESDVTVNQANTRWPVAMTKTTGAEIFRQMRGLVDAFAAARLVCGTRPGLRKVTAFIGAEASDVDRFVDRVTRKSQCRECSQGDNSCYRCS